MALFRISWPALLVWGGLLAGCGGPDVPPAPKTIRDVPWDDRVYDFDGPKRFENGAYRKVKHGKCAPCITILGTSFGDVDGDGSDEAIVLTNTNWGSQAQVTAGYVYKYVNGKPKQIGYIEGGDRGFGGIQRISIEDGVVIIRRLYSGPADPACCPSQVIIEQWNWTDGRLVQEEGTKAEPRAPTPWTPTSDTKPVR